MNKSKDYIINKNQKYIEITKTISPLKITGTRFAAVLNKDPFESPFQVWCEMWGLYKPKIDLKYKNSGNIIEKIIIEDLYLKYQKYNYNIIQPRICKSNSTLEFFPNNNIFGGRWDALLYNNNCTEILEVIEIKTTSLKNRDQWLREIPQKYLLQVSLYCYLLNVNHAQITVAFLDDKDYLRPKEFQISQDNVFSYKFNIYNMFPKFNSFIQYAKDWWKKYIITKKSPFYNNNDEKILTEIEDYIIENKYF